MLKLQDNNYNKNMQENYLEKSLKIVMYTLFAFLPIFFVPLAVNVELGRDIVFGLISFVAFSLWSAIGIKKGRVFFVRSLPLISSLFVLSTALLSSYFAKAPYLSFLYSGVTAEKGLTLLISASLLLILPVTVKSNDRFALKSLYVLFSAAAVAGLFILLQFIFGISVLGSIFAFARAADFNAIGTVNGLAMLFVGFLAGSISLMLFDGEEKNKYYNILLRIEAFIFLITICVIRSPLAFYSSFLVLTLSLILLLIKNGKVNNFEPEVKKYQKSLAIFMGAFFILICGNFGVIPATKQASPVEISPTHKLTWHIGVSTVKSSYKNALLGVGPASFGESWNLYKDQEINKTNFWSIKFNQGSSMLITSLTTLGILGFLAVFLLLVVSPVLLFLRLVVMSRRKTLEGIHVAYFVIVASSSFALIFYSTILAIVYLFFISLAILLTLVATEHSKKSNVLEKILAIENIEEKPDTYISGSILSMVLVVMFFLSLYGVFFEINRARSVFLQAFGYIALSSKDTESAVSYMERAVDVDSKNPLNQEALFDAYSAQNNDYLAKAAKGVDVKNDVTDFTPKIIATSNAMIALNPAEPSLWAKQAHLYESLILLIPNAEKYSVVSIKKTIDLDPVNPERAIDVAKIYLTVYDRMMIVQKNSKGEPSKALIDFTNESLVNAALYSEKAISIKPDYVMTHVVRAYIALRQAKNDLAVSEADKAKSILPMDATVAFESGIIRYKANDIPGAESEFKRALSIDKKYSDARYYLALVQYELGKKDDAIESMEEVLKANPDNKDIQTTLNKFKSGEFVSESSAQQSQLQQSEGTVITTTPQ